MGEDGRLEEADGWLCVTEPSPRFRDFLKAELLRRCDADSRYSLRAFARFLELEPSALSKILTGKRRVSAAMFSRLVGKLAHGYAERRAFFDTYARRGAFKISRAAESETFDAFKAVSDWYHTAIIEMVSIRGFRSDVSWIARALGIPQAEAATAVERLIRLGLLERRSGEQTLARPAVDLPVDLRDLGPATRTVQHQFLELASRALDDTPISEREQSTMTFAGCMDLLPEARKRIENFQREIAGLLAQRAPHEEVFHLSISLFPVTVARSIERKKG